MEDKEGFFQQNFSLFHDGMFIYLHLSIYLKLATHAECYIWCIFN